MIYAFAFILIIRAVFWGMSALKAHDLQQYTQTKEAHALIAIQKFTALSFLLETAFWFMVLFPQTLLAVGDFEIVGWIVTGIFSVQLLPAALVWAWWTERISAERTTITKLQTLFGILVIAVTLTGGFVLFYTVLNILN